MPFCSSCGGVLAIEAKFCSVCGQGSSAPRPQQKSFVATSNPREESNRSYKEPVRRQTNKFAGPTEDPLAASNAGYKEPVQRQTNKFAGPTEDPLAASNAGYKEPVRRQVQSFGGPKEDPLKASNSSYVEPKPKPANKFSATSNPREESNGLGGQKPCAWCQTLNLPNVKFCKKCKKPL